MGWNTPDDWNSYFHTCPRCGLRFHASEGCDCTDDLVECQSHEHDDEDRWTDEDEIVEIDGLLICKPCARYHTEASNT